MTLEISHSLHTIAVVPHVAAGISRAAVALELPRPDSPYQYIPSALVMVAAYLVVLVVLLVFGVFMGWQDPGEGGGGGGGRRRPRVQKPTPPSGPALTDDFEAWEGQLKSDADDQADKRQDVPIDIT